MATHRFSALAERTTDQVRERLLLYEYSLRGVRGAILSAGLERLNRRRFQQYSGSRDIDREFPGARGMGMIRRVTRADEQAYVAAARRDEQPDFVIRQLSPHQFERFVIEYIEPVARNKEAVGLDIASETNRRTAAIASMQTGRATLTGPITLVQATGNPQRSFLLLLPIYRPDAALTSVEQREQAAVGWSYAPLVMDEVLADSELGETSLALRDVALAADPPFFQTTRHGEPAAMGLTVRVPLSIYGRNWEAEFRATPEFVKALNLFDPLFAFGLGSLFAGLLSVLSGIYAQSARRKLEVHAEQARRAAIVQSSNDAIIGESSDGIVTDWNDGAEKLFGYSAEEALGRPAASLLLPEDRQEEDRQIRLAISRGDAVDGFDTTRLHADGTLRDVSVGAVPIRGLASDSRGFAMTIRDIGPAKRAEREIRELNATLERQVRERTAKLNNERHLMASLLDGVPDAIHFKDRNGRYLRINPALARLYGLSSPEDAVGKSDHDFLPADRVEEASLLEQQILASGEPVVEREEQQTWKDRDPTWSLTTRMPLCDDAGELIGTFGIARDITARRRMKAQLQRTSERFAMAADGGGIGVWEYDIQSNTLTWDDWMYRLYGRTRQADAESYELWANNLHPDDRQRAESELARALSGGEDFDTEFRVVKPDGNVRHLRAAARIAHGLEGEPLRMTGVNFDITERKRAEVELRETTSLLQGVLDAASEVSVIATDPHGLIKVFNAGAERLLHYRSAEVVNRGTPLPFHDSEEVEAHAKRISSLSGEQVQGFAALVHPLALTQPQEWTYVRKDGSRLSVSLTVTSILGEHGELFGYLGAAHDVTRQKQYEAQLRETTNQANQANQAKSQFLANMSHELRTPLSAVIGLSYLLGQTELNPEQAHLLSKLQLAGKSLLAVINDILDFSKIEAGELIVERAPFSLRILLSELHEMMLIQASSKGIGCEFDLPDDLPEALLGDATRLNQILINLLSNAIKFTTQGTVRLSVTRGEGPATSYRLRFAVRDTGIGIAADAQEKLFAPFAQADESTTRKFGGTGLGLSIVKRLAQMMNGDVGLNSTLGSGSTFWVTLEFGNASGHELPLREDVTPNCGTRPLSGVRVLLVDDSDINLELGARILELDGASVVCASNGEKALEKLRRGPSDFDIVLMDIQMPALDGLETTRRVRGELQLKLPIIALSADARTSERQAALSAGMNDFVSKPFEPSGLIRTIQQHTTGQVPSGLRAELTPPRSENAALWPDIDGIDSAYVRELLDGDVELFGSLLASLMDQISDLLIALDPNVSLPTSALINRVHRLRGSSGQLGARAVYELAGRLETDLNAGGEHQIALSERLSALLQQLQRAGRRYLGSLSTPPAPLTPEAGVPVDPLFGRCLN